MQNTGMPSISTTIPNEGEKGGSVKNAASKAELEHLGTATYAWFVRIYKRLNDDQTRFVQNYGVTPSQYGVMAVLMQEDGLTFTELGKRTVLHGSTLTGIIDRLERKDLVIRVNDARDRRQIQLSLTESGKNLFRTIPTIDKNGLLCGVLKALSEEERADLLRLLSRLGKEMGDAGYDELIVNVLNLTKEQE